MNKLIKLSIPQLIRDLNNGMTRFQHEDAGWGSIQQKYGMTDTEVAFYFRHPKLASAETIQLRFILSEEDFESEIDASPVAEPVITSIAKVPGQLGRGDFELELSGAASSVLNLL